MHYKHPLDHIVEVSDGLYDAAAFGLSSELIGRGQKLLAKHKPVDAQMLRLATRVDLTPFSQFASDPKFGTVLLHKLSGLVKRPDFTVEPVDLGLDPNPNGYWFMDFLPKTEKKLGFKEGDLASNDKGPDWLEVKDSKDKRLKALYSGYVDQTKNVIRRISESPCFSKATAPEIITFEQFVKERPILFYKDKLGRIQVYRKLFRQIVSGCD